MHILYYSDYLLGQILEYNTVVTKAEFLFMIQSVNLPPSAHTIEFSAHCSSHYIFSAHTAAAITSSVHTLQQPLHLQCTFQPCTAMYSYLQLYYPVHTAAILSSAHCSYTIQCTLQLFYPVYTAAILSSAHCSYTIQCTLQLYYPVHTAAILSSAHCSYSIQCTLQLHYLYSTSSAPLNHHRVSLYHSLHTSRAVSRH